MRFFVKAVASGFALSMGGAIFKKVSKKLGLDDDKDSKAEGSTHHKATEVEIAPDSDSEPEDQPFN